MSIHFRGIEVRDSENFYCGVFMKTLRIALLTFAILAAFAALLMCMAGALGTLGLLADVGPVENRKLGMEAFSYALAPAVISAACIISYLFTRTKSDKS